MKPLFSNTVVDCQSDPMEGIHAPCVVIVRSRDDGDIDLIDHRSRERIGQYREVIPWTVSGLWYTAVSVFFLCFAVGYMIWHFGRAYGRNERIEAEQPLRVYP